MYDNSLFSFFNFEQYVFLLRKVFNLNFHEVFSVISDMNSVLCMVFNSVTDELITGGTGGIRVSF